MNKPDSYWASKKKLDLPRPKPTLLWTSSLIKWLMHLQPVTGLKSEGCVLFMSSNTMPIPAGTRRAVS